jgi:hypothetical protein
MELLAVDGGVSLPKVTKIQPIGCTQKLYENIRGVAFNVKHQQLAWKILEITENLAVVIMPVAAPMKNYLFCAVSSVVRFVVIHKFRMAQSAL